jgi:dTDP-4-amino-4,6-dideoxygalactose transaminase
MTARGIDTGIHYPLPVHLQPAYADLGYCEGDFPIAEQAAAEVFSLPVYPEMDESLLSQVAAALRSILDANGRP